MVAFNYRMPNINAALLVAQLEKINLFLANKRNLALSYIKFFKESNYIDVVKNRFVDINSKVKLLGVNDVGHKLLSKKNFVVVFANEHEAVHDKQLKWIYKNIGLFYSDKCTFEKSI